MARSPTLDACVPITVGASFTLAACSVTVAGAAERPPASVSETVKVVCTVAPAAAWFAVGVNTAPCSVACTAAGAPVTV